MDEKILEELKEEYKIEILKEYGENEYFKLIGEKTKWINEFKKVGDKVFGENNQMFREECRISIIEESEHLGEFERLCELALLDLALDVILGTNNKL